MSKKQTNKCKNCGGGLYYNCQTEELKCTHCGSTFPIASSKKENAKYAYDQSVVPKSATENFSQYKCNNCKGLCVSGFMDDKELRCPSCGSGDLSKTVSINYEPDGIFPFKLEKETALQKFKAWMKKRKMAPRNLKKIATLDKVVGAYCPCWNFDFKDTFSYSCVGVTEKEHKDGHVTKSYTNESDTITTNHYNYLQSANASVSAQDLRQAGNFNYDDLKTYAPAYMYGFTGLISDITVQRAMDITSDETAIKNERNIKSELRLKYDDIENFRCSTSLFNTYYNNVYIPMWLINYKYKKKNYRCYVNGVNGATSGNAPVSWVKVLLIILAVLGVVGLIAWLVNR